MRPLRFFLSCRSKRKQDAQKGERRVNSKKAKALVHGLILKRQGMQLNELKRAIGGLMTEPELMQSLALLQQEGRVSQTVRADTYVSTDLLDRIEENVRRAAMESRAESKGEYGIPSSLVEALKERRRSVY